MLFLGHGVRMVVAGDNKPATLPEHATLDDPGITTGRLLLSLTGFLIKGPHFRMDFPHQTTLRRTVMKSSPQPHCRTEVVPQQGSQRTCNEPLMTISYPASILSLFSPGDSNT